MSSDITVKFERTRQLAAELDAEAAKVKQILEEETALMADIGGMWSGTASDQFNQQYSEWNKEADEEAAALDKLCAAVHAGIDTLHSTETDVTGMFS
ncbi:WXG100 family type VII secretion target [Mycolicibacterium porcinum]|uniref:WXG100 family type VII secretion target n=1 Tax=Mycolicibacterium porcinum TaxID=39693 RepID=UPI001195908A|nr:WXG100 family type VII secretion target [Mycolicibacterium porcinum]TVY04897.1 WXG100 family type VII secretion target [Mycolicibacterium porcinum]